MHLVHLVCVELTSEMSGAFGALLVKTIKFYVQRLHSYTSCAPRALSVLKLSSDLFGSFGAFGVFLVKTLRFYV